MPRAEIICVGTELLAGKTNTHVAYLAPRLRAAGLDVPREATVADSHAEIRDTVGAAAGRSQVVVVCGGLGPTFDDITREAVADALGRELIYRPAIFAGIRRKFLRYRFSVPANNKRQAWVIHGARALENRRGSAPGQFLALSRNPLRCVVLLPGPFDEMRALFDDAVEPPLRLAFGVKHATRERVFRFCGLGESAADRLLRPLLDRPGPGVGFTILAGIGLVSLHAAAAAETAAAAGARLDAVEKRARRIMGRHLFGTDRDTLESVVGERLRRRRWRLATAESCTGGLLAQRLTSVPGSSDYFAGSVVAYQNAVKSALLGVSDATLRREGAVSAACAREMARGARERLGTDAAVSVTGIAGPGGGSRKKPVGLTYIGISLGRRKTLAFRFCFPGGRRQIRERAASAALLLLWRLLP